MFQVVTLLHAAVRFCPSLVRQLEPGNLLSVYKATCQKGDQMLLFLLSQLQVSLLFFFIFNIDRFEQSSHYISY